MNSQSLSLLLCLFLLGCSTMSSHPTQQDENLWLEEVHSPAALKWVESQNSTSLKNLTERPQYAPNLSQAREILLSQDRLPNVSSRAGYLYNFWQDGTHVRGLIRRTKLESLSQKHPHWETVLDIDALAAEEKEDWVYKGAQWLGPHYTHGLIHLSRGGLDASVVREFDLKTKSFVRNRAFTVPQAKTRIDWVNENSVVIATDFGPGSLTKSGYPRIVKLWHRGEALSSARVLLEGTVDDVSAGGNTDFTPEGATTYIYRSPSFYTDIVYTLEASGQLKKIEKPDSAILVTTYRGRKILQLRKAWKEFSEGSVISLRIDGTLSLIFAPNARQSVAEVEPLKDALAINYLDSISSHVVEARLIEGHAGAVDTWKLTPLAFPLAGDLSFEPVEATGDLILAKFQSFLTPPSILALKLPANHGSETVKPKSLKSLPSRFDSKDFHVEQLWAKSKDGTEIPYFLISKKSLVKDGSNPVLIHGYGGFEVSLSPSYLSLTGKLWLEKGGVFVETNIRGGGEFGPKWHEAALLENRQRAFDDFEGIAEDLIRRKISVPAKIGIQGRSNGGLLVGTAFTQRPDLYGAVVCGVPLLDMLRYNKLLAGASWEGEYGNPDDPKMHDVLLKYSPYQNLHKETKYPEVFFYTSTTDDRVHPGHARKMVARMQAQGHPYLYFENTVGGHAGSADLEQESKIQALIFTFLQSRLMTK